MNKTTRCECEEPAAGKRTFFCHRHKVHKTAGWWRLCCSHPSYFRLWEEGRGPGQTASEAERPPLVAIPAECHGCEELRNANPMAVFCQLDVVQPDGRICISAALGRFAARQLGQLPQCKRRQ
jgi:hypothetical protein